jgi:DNA replication protein DnaC
MSTYSDQSVAGLTMSEKGFFDHCVPKKYQDAVLDSLDKQPIGLIEFGRQWAKNPTSLYLHGNTGSGKTRFTFAIIRQAFRSWNKHFWPRYYTAPQLDSILHEAIINTGDKYVIDNLKKEDMLFIDDFGRENKTDRIKRQYFEIFNYRYSNELPTIITSNFDVEWVNREVSDVIASRIQEWDIIRFTGPDLRKKEIVFKDENSFTNVG